MVRDKQTYSTISIKRNLKPLIKKFKQHHRDTYSDCVEHILKQQGETIEQTEENKNGKDNNEL
jgi:hypothetical protein